MKIFRKIYMIPFIGNKLKWRMIKKTGGMQESKKLREFTKEFYKVDVGMYSYGSVFDKDFNIGGKSVTVGKYCSFASNIHYFGANHPMNYVSMSPYFYNKSFGKNVVDIKRSELTIGNDVWCGYGVIITNGCKTIGNGSVIAAGAVVTKDVPPYAVVAGIPARVIKYRFSKEIIDVLEKSKWWDMEPDALLKCYDCINNPIEFCRRIQINESIK